MWRYRMVTLSDLFPAIERDYLINRKRSLRNVRSSWRKHLQPAFGHIPAEALTTDEVEAYIVSRQAAGAQNATINRETAVLKRIYKLALRARKISVQPYIPALEESNVREGFLKDEEYDALARETAVIGLWLRGAFEVAVTYGWRKSELFRMKVAQVDLMERTIRLNHKTKNKDARVVYMTAKVFELLRQSVSGKQPDDLVFTRELDRAGRRTKTRGRIADMRDAWAEACERAGVKGLLFHDLRRSAVSNMIADGIDEKTAMLNSGHLTREVFDRYHIVRPNAMKDAAQKMEKGARERQTRARFNQTALFEVQKKAS